MDHVTGRIPRNFITALAAASITMAVQGQVSVGFRGGVNWAKMSSKEGLVGTPPTRLGPTGAVVFSIPVAKSLTLVPEIGFTQLGHGAEASPLSFYGGQKLALDYADLGLMVRAHVAEGPPTRPYVLAGATVGYLVGARLFELDPWTNNYKGTVLDPGDVHTSPWSSGHMNRWNMDLCAGLGFMFTAGRSQVFVEGRYQYGLTNIWNDVPVADVNGSPVGVLQCYDRSISVSLGWLIPLGADAGKGGEAPSE
ncbi:MAG: PorT family protein [Bacteroidetes bacterium]|nr:PorT family protein [Bacteroidota bacterium]